MTLSDLDEATKLYYETRQVYEEKQAEAAEASLVMKEAQRKLINLLEESGRSNWEIDEGKVIVTNKIQYSTPKTIEEKQALAKYLQDTYGKEQFWTLFGVNSQTLNAWAKQEIEQNPEVIIPGLDAPTHATSLSFRRSRKK